MRRPIRVFTQSLWRSGKESEVLLLFLMKKSVEYSIQRAAGRAGL